MSTSILDKSGAQEMLNQLKTHLDKRFNEAALALYPIGTVLFTPSTGYDPNDSIGGTWTRSDTWSTTLAKGGFYPRMMSADEEIETAVNMDSAHKLSVSNLPMHRHSTGNLGVETMGTSYNRLQSSSSGDEAVSTTTSSDTTVDSVGGNVLASKWKIEPTYYAVYAWKRIA